MIVNLPSILRFCANAKRHLNARNSSQLLRFLATSFNDSQRVFTSAVPQFKEKNTITVTFLDADGNHFCTTSGPEGSSLLDLAKEAPVPFDGYGECDGGLSCTTCHVVLAEKDYKLLENKIHPEEDDLLTRSNTVLKTSRLGCQVCITKELNGITVRFGPDTEL